jgi:hypothetical protein
MLPARVPPRRPPSYPTLRSRSNPHFPAQRWRGLSISPLSLNRGQESLRPAMAPSIKAPDRRVHLQLDLATSAAVLGRRCRHSLSTVVARP